jgi:polysaccharide pyruvyl transferase WcaK-like protein
MKTENTIFLAFDFYGDGNIGDDLMLAGFLDGLKTLNCKAQIVGSSKVGIYILKKRFPSVSWIAKEEFNALGAGKPRDGLLAGVGDTPLQILCGREWMLDYLLNLNKLFMGMRRVMVNIGAESEIRSHMEEFKIAVSKYERISTRDEMSATIARELLPDSSNRVIVGGDLASLALRLVSFPPRGAATSIAQSLILAGDTLNQQDLSAVAEYLVNAESPVDFIANDINTHSVMEQALYKRLAPRKFFGLLRRGQMRVPDYDTSDWKQLVQPYMKSDVVVSARYHGLLCAAYSGCRIGAIARSSKVEALARELNVPFCLPPLTESKIRNVFTNACAIDKNVLVGMEERALNGIAHCLKA